MNKTGEIPPRTLQITARDLLKNTKRRTDGDSYERLKAALERLAGVSITTNIKTNGMRAASGFGLIDEWHIIEKSPTDDRMIKLEITLSRWVYNSVIGREVLTVDEEYFNLRKPLDRRLYQIARKHCGKKKTKWNVSLDKLYFKTGARMEKYKFRKYIKEMKPNRLPRYMLSLKKTQDKEIIEFIAKDIEHVPAKTSKQRIRYPKAPDSNMQLELFAGSHETVRLLLGQAYDNAHHEIKKAQLDLDINHLVNEWRAYTLECMSKGNPPNNFQGSFMGFVRTKIKQATASYD